MSADAGAPPVDAERDPAPAGGNAPRRPSRRRRVSVLGILGELLLTAGVLVLAFLGWQLWLSDALAAGPLKNQATEQSRKWDQQAGTSGASSKPTELLPGDASIPVLAAPANKQVFANLIVPRFGTGFYRPVAQGVGNDVLDDYLVGHYPTTQLPGQNGNVVLASHRTAYGGALHTMNELRVGDHIYLETKDGWYMYTFRNLEYVKRSGIGVLDPVPQQSGVTPTQQMLTLTTCNPVYSTAERIIGYAPLTGFYPRAGGPPAEIAATVPSGGGS